MTRPEAGDDTATPPPKPGPSEHAPGSTDTGNTDTGSTDPSKADPDGISGDSAGLGAADPGGKAPRRVSPHRIGLALLVAAMLAFWVWIFTAAPRDNPDRFDDPAFAGAAEPLCAAVQARIDALPAGHTAAGPAERAVAVREGTVLTVQMVDGLRRLAAEIEAAEQADTLAAWLSDWDVYIADRWAHVERLESADADTDARQLAFVVSEVVGGGHYTRRIDGLANVNDMKSCHVPLDI